MGRKPKDRRLGTLKESLLSRLVDEKEPKTIIDLLTALEKVLDLMERGKLPEVLTDFEKLKANAQIMARKAFPIPQKCSKPNCTKIGQRHHEDYTKPLEITWLCEQHHKEREAEIRQEAEAKEK